MRFGFLLRFCSFVLEPNLNLNHQQCVSIIPQFMSQSTCRGERLSCRPSDSRVDLLGRGPFKKACSRTASCSAVFVWRRRRGLICFRSLKHALKFSLLGATYLLRFFCRSPLASRGGTGTRESVKIAWEGLHSYDRRRRVHLLN